MSRQVNIDKLNEHLFESIEMLKNNSDPKASANEKMDLDTAKAISSLAKVAVEGYKVKVQALGIITNVNNANPIHLKQIAAEAGIIEGSDKILEE